MKVGRFLDVEIRVFDEKHEALGIDSEDVAKGIIDLEKVGVFYMSRDSDDNETGTTVFVNDTPFGIKHKYEDFEMIYLQYHNSLKQGLQAI